MECFTLCHWFNMTICLLTTNGRTSKHAPMRNFILKKNPFIYKPVIYKQYFLFQVNMYENMYLVTENEFMKCEFHGTTHDSKKVMDCNSPLNNYKLKYHMFYFSAFTTSDGIPFFPDRTYYFIGELWTQCIYTYQRVEQLNSGHPRCLSLCLATVCPPLSCGRPGFLCGRCLGCWFSLCGITLALHRLVSSLSTFCGGAR